MSSHRQRGRNPHPLVVRTEHFLAARRLYRAEVKEMFNQIRGRPDVVERLPHLLAYAMHQPEFLPTLQLADSMMDRAFQKVLYRGLSFYVRDSPWQDQVDFVAHRLLPAKANMPVPTRRILAEAKRLDSAADRSRAQHRVVQRARLTQSARPFQLAFLNDVGWTAATIWLKRQPYAVSQRRQDSGEPRRARLSSEEIKALKLPRLNLKSRTAASKTKPTTQEESASSTIHRSTSTVRPGAGALVVFDEDLVIKLAASLKQPQIRIVNADTYFLAESLSIHERWLLAFPTATRVTSSLVVDEAEVLIREKGLVVNLWYRSQIVDRVNLQLPPRRHNIALSTKNQRAVSFLLLYVFSNNRRLKKSTTEGDLEFAAARTKAHFRISSIYRITTATTFAEMAAHAGFAVASRSVDLPQHEVRGYLRMRNGEVHRVRPHRKGG